MFSWKCCSITVRYRLNTIGSRCLGKNISFFLILFEMFTKSRNLCCRMVLKKEFTFIILFDWCRSFYGLKSFSYLFVLHLRPKRTFLVFSLELIYLKGMGVIEPVQIKRLSLILRPLPYSHDSIALNYKLLSAYRRTELVEGILIRIRTMAVTVLKLYPSDRWT